MNPGLTKSYRTSAIVARRRIVVFSGDNTVAQAAAATAALIGISDMSSDVASGGSADIRRTGIAELDLAGAITRGMPVTADANGKGVLCNPAAGTTASYIGFLEAVTGANGDIGDVFICPGRLTTPA